MMERKILKFPRMSCRSAIIEANRMQSCSPRVSGDCRERRSSTLPAVHPCASAPSMEVWSDGPRHCWEPHFRYSTRGMPPDASAACAAEGSAGGGGLAGWGSADWSAVRWKLRWRRVIYTGFSLHGPAVGWAKCLMGFVV